MRGEIKEGGRWGEGEEDGEELKHGRRIVKLIKLVYES